MHLDVNTLFIVTTNVEALLGLLLLFVWVQNTAITAVAWWSFAHFFRAASIALFGLYGSVPDLISIDLANALLFTAYATLWTGARVFENRPVEPVYLVTGAVLWLLVCRLPILAEAPSVRVLVASGIITAYIWLACYEFCRERSERLVSRWPAVSLLFAHGALFLLRTPLIAILPGPQEGMFASVWLTAISFEALLLTISIAFILLAMVKERTELLHRTAVTVDPLTGMANRRSFLQDAAALAKRYVSHPRPTAVLAIDLDNFKSINDRFGHASGDRILEIFADAARQIVRSSDPIGRLGGDEFAAILYDVSPEKAEAVAERIRTLFAQSAIDVDGKPIAATLSIGIAHCDGPMLDLQGLLARADQALYFAKKNGRDRVEIAASTDVMLNRVKLDDAPLQPDAVAGAAQAKSAV
jgi:diguanylate cyclase (GGDEF)-like protein